MSRTRVVFTCVLEAVSAETDVAVSRIMSRCSDAETVDARWICVSLLRGEGYYPSRIAELMGISPRYVQYILTDFEDRISLSGMMRKNYERSAQRLRSVSERSA